MFSTKVLLGLYDFPLYCNWITYLYFCSIYSQTIFAATVLITQISFKSCIFLYHRVWRSVHLRFYMNFPYCVSMEIVMVPISPYSLNLQWRFCGFPLSSSHKILLCDCSSWKGITGLPCVSTPDVLLLIYWWLFARFTIYISLGYLSLLIADASPCQMLMSSFLSSLHILYHLCVKGHDSWLN